MSKLRIGDKLIAKKIITEEQLEQGLQEQQRRRDDGIDENYTLIGIILVDLGFVTKQQVLDNLFK